MRGSGPKPSDWSWTSGRTSGSCAAASTPARQEVRHDTCTPTPLSGSQRHQYAHPLRRQAMRLLRARHPPPVSPAWRLSLLRAQHSRRVHPRGAPDGSSAANRATIASTDEELASDTRSNGSVMASASPTRPQTTDTALSRAMRRREPFAAFPWACARRAHACAKSPRTRPGRTRPAPP